MIFDDYKEEELSNLAEALLEEDFPSKVKMKRTSYYIVPREAGLFLAPVNVPEGYGAYYREPCDAFCHILQSDSEMPRRAHIYRWIFWSLAERRKNGK